jgi:hypothetical protein
MRGLSNEWMIEQTSESYITETLADTCEDHVHGEIVAGIQVLHHILKLYQHFLIIAAHTLWTTHQRVQIWFEKKKHNNNNNTTHNFKRWKKKLGNKFPQPYSYRV